MAYLLWIISILFAAQPTSTEAQTLQHKIEERGYYTYAEERAISVAQEIFNDAYATEEDRDYAKELLETAFLGEERDPHTLTVYPVFAGDEEVVLKLPLGTTYDLVSLKADGKSLAHVTLDRRTSLSVPISKQKAGTKISIYGDEKEIANVVVGQRQPKKAFYSVYQVGKNYAVTSDPGVFSERGYGRMNFDLPVWKEGDDLMIPLPSVLETLGYIGQKEGDRIILSNTRNKVLPQAVAFLDVKEKKGTDWTGAQFSLPVIQDKNGAYYVPAKALAKLIGAGDVFFQRKGDALYVFRTR